MKVSEVMVTDITVVHEDSTVVDAVLLLADEHISGLPVIDGSGKLVGVLSTTDILNAVAEVESAEGREQLFEKTMVGELMTPNPKTVPPTADVHEAAQLMLSLEVHRLFVEEGDQLVGVVSQSDIVRAVATTKI